MQTIHFGHMYVRVCAPAWTNTQQAKNIGPIWAPDQKLYGSYLGNPYGTDVGFATGIHLGPIWAHPYGNHMGPIWGPI